MDQSTLDEMKQVRQSKLPGSVHLLPLLFFTCPRCAFYHYIAAAFLFSFVVSARRWLRRCRLAWVGGWPKAGRGLPVGLAESGRPQYLDHSYTPCAPRQAKPIRPNTA